MCLYGNNFSDLIPLSVGFLNQWSDMHLELRNRQEKYIYTGDFNIPYRDHGLRRFFLNVLSFHERVAKHIYLHTVNSIKSYGSVKPRRFFSMGSFSRQSGQAKIFTSCLLIFLLCIFVIFKVYVGKKQTFFSLFSTWRWYANKLSNNYILTEIIRELKNLTFLHY